MPIDPSGNNPPGNPSGAAGPLGSESTAPATARAPASVMTLWALYALEVVAIGILRIPHDLGLFMFAFGDRGSWLVAQYLDAHGARPTIDFGFPYGLLPLLFGRAWFAIFGLTPSAFNAAMMAGGVAMAFGMARFANAMRLNRTGQLLIVVALPVAIQSSMPGFSHLLEAVALCLAIGEHAGGNRGAALALATVACFAKAALGYLYGFLLVLMIVAHCRRSATNLGTTSGDASYRPASFDWPMLRRMLMPAVVTALILLAIVGPVFGVHPLIASLLPLSGMKIYRSQHFSFFTPWARTFWDPRSQPLGLYLATVAPFWLASTVWLAFAGLLAVSHLSKSHLFAPSRSPLPDDDAATFAGSHSSSSPPNDARVDHLRNEIVLCCAVLQTLFVLRFFGPPASWTYYPYIVVMGVAAASMMNAVTMRITMLLVFVAFVALDASLVIAGSQWKTSTPSALTASLWADAADRAEWSTVTHLITAPRSPTSNFLRSVATASPRAVAIGVAGAASILFPEFEKPLGAYLVRDEATPAEVARVIEQIKAADFVVRPVSVSIGDPIYAWPEMVRAFDNFDVVFKGRTFQVLGRR